MVTKILVMCFVLVTVIFGPLQWKSSARVLRSRNNYSTFEAIFYSWWNSRKYYTRWKYIGTHTRKVCTGCSSYIGMVGEHHWLLDSYFAGNADSPFTFNHLSRKTWKTASVKSSLLSQREHARIIIKQINKLNELWKPFYLQVVISFLQRRKKEQFHFEQAISEVLKCPEHCRWKRHKGS